MSSAFYPQGMNTWNNRLPQGGYKSWKGKGAFSNPVGITATHIRPLTNNDPGNVFPTGFGLARPIKHYRKGTVIQLPLEQINRQNEQTAADVEKDLIAYNVNRAVASSSGQSLGGGSGGTGLISQLSEMPGYAIIKDNNLVDNTIDKECTNCRGVGFVSDWYPIDDLTEKPQANVTNPLLCCNQQRKAVQRVLPASTNVKKNYYQTTYMYLYNRCQTFKQREFNFVHGPIDQTILNLFKAYPFVTAKILEYSKPGDPLSIVNQYVAQCNPNFTVEQGAEIVFIAGLSKQLLDAGFIDVDQYNSIINSPNVHQFIDVLKLVLTQEQFAITIEYLYQLAANPYNGSVVSGPSNPRGCAQVYYKPNNPQFAKQGAVSSSTRLLKLNVDTITKNAASQSRRSAAGTRDYPYPTANQLYAGNNPVNPFITKAKPNPTCQLATYIGNPFFFQGTKQNKKLCSKTTGDEYKDFVSVYQHSRGNYIGATQP